MSNLTLKHHNPKDINFQWNLKGPESDAQNHICIATFSIQMSVIIGKQEQFLIIHLE